MKQSIEAMAVGTAEVTFIYLENFAFLLFGHLYIMTIKSIIKIIFNLILYNHTKHMEID